MRSCAVWVPVTLALCSVLGIRAALADATEEAKLHNRQARILFNLGHFGEAAEEYEQAYRASPTPVLLYNLAQCYLRLGGLEQLRRAAHALDGYLRGVPAAPNRAAVEERLRELRQQISRLEEQRQQRQQRATPAGQATLAPRPAPAPLPRPSSLLRSPQTAPAPLPRPPRRPFHRRWWFWTLIGTAAAAAATGLAVGLASSSGRVPRGTELHVSEFH